jgi:hypothetical protein
MVKEECIIRRVKYYSEQSIIEQRVLPSFFRISGIEVKYIIEIKLSIIEKVLDLYFMQITKVILTKPLNVCLTDVNILNGENNLSSVHFISS